MANVGQFVYAWIESLMARDEEGQGLVEYALIIALISVALVAALGTLKGSISGVFSSIGTSLGVS